MTTTTDDAPAVTAMLDDLAAQGWSQKAIAAEVGAAQNTVSAWTTGNTAPTPPRQAALVALWRETLAAGDPEPGRPDWRAAPCRVDPRAWTDPISLDDARAAAGVCRRFCPVLEACKRMRLDSRRDRLPIYGVLAGHLPKAAA